MFHVENLLGTSNVRCRVAASSRKRVIQYIAEMMATSSVNTDQLFDALMNRERLGSTGLGDGVAIPHCRVACSEIQAACITLAEPIDYEAADGQPVDLLFVLVVPEDEHNAHLEALAVLAETFAEAANREALRACASDDALLARITEQLRRPEPNSQTA